MLLKKLIKNLKLYEVIILLSVIYFFLNPYITDITYFLLSMIFPFKAEENYFILDNGFKILVENECNGLLGILIFVFALYLFGVREKKAYILGVFYAFFINILRIVLIVFLTNSNSEYFNFYHNILGRVFYVFLFLLGLFYFKKLKSDTDFTTF